ncbi:MAG: 4-(cytidine 5'-diphospho)-2-C-methyl-D-erythritol kinase [Chlorobiota bacterium]|nr:MAG: 4-(cytidine 5'-diphospho)-2-C-methyl-D-erythritol kinase [Chlorobiota bacterium]
MIHKSPAKINLALEILNRRDDGYHNIISLFSTVNLFDELKIENLSTGLIRCIVNGNDKLSTEIDNLCISAAKLLRETANNNLLGAEILLKKNIPIGAGLGGGSSDAATTLIILNEIWKLNLSISDLKELAFKLGSDVPYFIEKGLVEVSSRGEVIKKIHIKLPYTVLLVNPGIHIPTVWAYNSLIINLKKENLNLENLLFEAVNDVSLFKKYFVNDFENVVFKEYPGIKKIKDQMYDNGSFFSLMSGSGSTVFGLFEDFEKANLAKQNFDNCFTYVCNFI